MWFGISAAIGNTIAAGIVRPPGDMGRWLPNPWLFLAVWAAGGGNALLGASAPRPNGEKKPGIRQPPSDVSRRAHNAGSDGVADGGGYSKPHAQNLKQPAAAAWQCGGGIGCARQIPGSKAVESSAIIAGKGEIASVKSPHPGGAERVFSAARCDRNGSLYSDTLFAKE